MGDPEPSSLTSLMLDLLPSSVACPLAVRVGNRTLRRGLVMVMTSARRKRVLRLWEVSRSGGLAMMLANASWVESRRQYSLSFRAVPLVSVSLPPSYLFFLSFFQFLPRLVSCRCGCNRSRGRGRRCFFCCAAILPLDDRTNM